MRCDCCGKRKGWLEAYEAIFADETTLHVCVKCSSLLYKLRYSVDQKEPEDYSDAKN